MDASLQKSPVPAPVQSGTSDVRQSVFAGIAWVGGVFTLLMAVALFFTYQDGRAHDPFHSSQMQELKARLHQSPNDEPLKKEIRQLDWSLRQRHFLQAERIRSGALLLLAGTALFVFAMRQVLRPVPQTAAAAPVATLATAPPPKRTANRWTVAAVGACLGALLFVLSLRQTIPLPQGPAEIDKFVGADSAPAAPAAPDAASPEELKANWPRFRGVDAGLASAFASSTPNWNAQSGSGILWKVPMPTAGFNSPILWGDRVFLSGGDAAKREVVCLDLKSGQVLWRQEVKGSSPAPTGDAQIPESTGYAAATMATDGRRVYAIFANGDLGAFTLEGKPVWTKSFGTLKNAYGHATSLLTFKDRLIVQLDQGDSDEGKSRLYALDGRTGQIVWQKPRKVGASWASPILVEAAGKSQIITLAVPWATAYNATDGAELWHVDCISGEVTPSPVFAAGLVLAPSPGEKISAIRPDGAGDVTKTHVAWTTEESIPDVTSPVANNELLFAVTTSGQLTCFDLATGKRIWDKDLELEFHASPLLAGNRLYLFSQKGVAVVVEASRQFKELFRANLADGIHASPAVAGNRMVVRGTQYVWCLEGSK
jgi:outer membrane protein assembly factor BamB